MSINVGLLIIGSLIWRQNRQTWLNQRWRTKKKIVVSAPIRYGRLSGSQTFTMVFAPSCQPGTALVIPCSVAINDFADLEKEAIELWNAETNWKSNGIDVSSDWGCVALLPNPDSRRAALYGADWTTYIRHKANQHANYTCFPAVANEIRAVNDDGILQIDWPVAINGGDSELAKLDLLLVTANYPTPVGQPPSYPTVQIIAAAWNRHGHRDYFDNNRQNACCTFQDPAIDPLLV